MIELLKGAVVGGLVGVSLMTLYLCYLGIL